MRTVVAHIAVECWCVGEEIIVHSYSTECGTQAPRTFFQNGSSLITGRDSSARDTRYASHRQSHSQSAAGRRLSVIRPDAVQLLVEPSCAVQHAGPSARRRRGGRRLFVAGHPPYGSARSAELTIVHVRSSTAHTLCISCARGVRTERASERERGRAASQPSVRA